MLPRRLVLLPRALLGVLLLVLAACASAPRVPERLSVGLVDLRPLESTAFESRLVLVVRVTNASLEPLRLTGSRHHLALNGRALGTAVSPEPLEIPALSSATQELTFNLSHLALLPLVQEFRRQSTARYEIESTFFGAGFLARGLTARQSGALDLAGLAGAAEARPAGSP
jgi:hypothetical protein